MDLVQISASQGYLAHEKTPNPLGPPHDGCGANLKKFRSTENGCGVWTLNVDLDEKQIGENFKNSKFS